MKINHIADYRLKRADAYPDVKEQLDMLWHGMDLDPSKRIEPFYSTIREIKISHPKESSSIIVVDTD